jgi:hypothetical protein
LPLWPGWLVGAALAPLAATLPHFHRAHSGFSLAGIASFEGGPMGIIANAIQILGEILVFATPSPPARSASPSKPPPSRWSASRLRSPPGVPKQA